MNREIRSFPTKILVSVFRFSLTTGPLLSKAQQYIFLRQNHQHMALRNGKTLLAQKIARRSNGAESLTAGNSAIFTFVPM